jgi:hypothetical protein
MEITATATTFADALTQALNQIIEPTRSREDAARALPLRAREHDLPAVAKAMIDELVTELGDGARVNSVQIDGLMKREGEYICWGYAFAEPEHDVAGRVIKLRELSVKETLGRYEVRLELEEQSK